MLMEPQHTSPDAGPRHTSTYRGLVARAIHDALEDDPFDDPDLKARPGVDGYTYRILLSPRDIDDLPWIHTTSISIDRGYVEHVSRNWTTGVDDTHPPVDSMIGDGTLLHHHNTTG